MGSSCRGDSLSISLLSCYPFPSRSSAPHTAAPLPHRGPPSAGPQCGGAGGGEAERRRSVTVRSLPCRFEIERSGFITTIMTTERRTNVRSRSASLSQPPVLRYLRLRGRAGKLRGFPPSRPLSVAKIGAGPALPAAHGTRGRGSAGRGRGDPSRGLGAGGGRSGPTGFAFRSRCRSRAESARGGTRGPDRIY